MHRLVPDIPFPPHAYIPGRTSHPAGQGRGLPLPTPERVDLENWQECRSYLYGIDLFNAHYYWEAHEEWESLWVAVGRTGPLADFLKALIKLAAASVKYRQGMPQGTHAHARRAAELLRGVAGTLGTSHVLGLALPELIAVAESSAHAGWPETAPVLTPAL